MTSCLLQDDYDTWAVFDFTLSMAIAILTWHNPCQTVPLYTGLRDVYVESTKLSRGCAKQSCFPKAHTSFSTRREVAETFRGERGALISLPPQTFSLDCKIGGMAPVAWISKFGDNEAEVLFSRFTFFAMSFQQTSFADECQEVQATWINNYAPAKLLSDEASAGSDRCT